MGATAKKAGWTYEVHELSEGYSAIVYDEHGQAIADHLTEKQARLIAGAPVMLAALKKARGAITALTPWGGVSAEANGAQYAIDAAIAKAEAHD